MPGKPPPVQPLEYQTPAASPRRNTPLKFLGRMCLGVCLGIAGCLAGWWLASVTNIQWLFFLPLGAALASAIVIAVKFKRYGYVTGVIVAPFLIVAALIVMLLIVCGGMLTHAPT